MRRARFTRPGIVAAVFGVSLLAGLIIAEATSAVTYPGYPTYPTTTTTTTTTGSPSSGSPSTKQVTIQGMSTYRFQPKTLRIKRGTKVKWMWQSNAPHNVTFTSLGKHSRTGASGSYRLRFNKPGTFRYECSIHLFKGKIVVH